MDLYIYAHIYICNYGNTYIYIYLISVNSKVLKMPIFLNLNVQSNNIILQRDNLWRASKLPISFQ